MMMQIFGHFSDKLLVSQEYLTIVFSPSSVPVKQRWRTNGLSADFMADYFATFFPGDEETSSGTNIQAEVKSAASFIANELLENAMKFNDESSHYPITLSLQMDSHQLVFFATNSIHRYAVSKFQALIEELTQSDPSELYIRHLEKSSEDENETSGLGLLTMMNDYQAQLGWKFETVQENPPLIAVTTRVQLTL